MTSDRRTFIEAVGMAVLTVQCLPLTPELACVGGRGKAIPPKNRPYSHHGPTLEASTQASSRLMVHASENPPSDGQEAADSLIVRSGPGLLNHVHDLLVPYAVLNAPPTQGVELTSTKALLHQHTIALTQKELTTVSRGGTVTQKASSHVFVIALAKRQGHIQAG